VGEQVEHQLQQKFSPNEGNSQPLGSHALFAVPLERCPASDAFSGVGATETTSQTTMTKSKPQNKARNLGVPWTYP